MLTQDGEASGLDPEGLHTSVTTHTEFLVYFYDQETGAYTIPAATLIPNLLELVPARPESHEEGLLAASAFIDEYGLTPFDAVHAGIAHADGESVLPTEQDYDEIGIERVPLDGFVT